MAILYWGTDYFDPNSQRRRRSAPNPDDSDASKLKILAWRNHFKDDELTAMVDAAAKELDGAKRVAMYQRHAGAVAASAPFVMLLQQISTSVLGKGVTGFQVGPLPDYTRYADIAKA